MKAFSTTRFQLILLLILVPVLISAQGKQANTWYFGHNAGLSFAAGDPVALTDGKIYTKEGCATISTPQGALQFYTDGLCVFDRNHDTMPNGRGLAGHPSSTQSALIVPVPGSITTYYIFTTDAGENQLQNGLRYSKVDMTLNYYKGDVIPDEKNILLAYPTCEKVTATLHRGGESYWVITKMFENSEFRAYRITTSGLQPDAVISNTGPSNAGFDYYSGMGALKISPDGKWLAMANVQTQSVGFYKFDDYTGFVTHVATENVDPILAYGVEFSPNSKLVYVSDRYETRIIQYDLSIEDSTSIINSRIELTLHNSTPDSTTALQLGPDNRIYVSRNSYNYISRINYPNLRGDACGYQQNAVNLNGKYCVEGLPPFIQSFFFPLQVKVEQNCSGVPTQFTLENPEGIDSLRWDFNDPANAPNDHSTLFNPAYQFSHADTFYVRLTAWAEIGPRTILDTVIIYEQPVPDLGPDTAFCPNEPFSLPLYAGPIGQYFWNGSPFAGSNSYVVTDTGYFWVRVNNYGCIASDTIKVSGNDSLQIALVHAYHDHCGHGVGKLEVFPVIGDPGDYLYSINGVDYYANGGIFSNLPAGPYSITLKTPSGCISEVEHDTIIDRAGPEITCIPGSATGNQANGTITVISPEDNLTYQLEGGLSQSGNVFTGLVAATYYVIVTDEYGCVTRDTVIVDSQFGMPLVAMAEGDRKCLHKPASADIRITRFTEMTDLNATLYFDGSILNCTNFNADTANFPGITAEYFTQPARVELAWHGANPVTSTIDTLMMGRLIFETMQYGIANMNWELNSAITYFLNQYGDTIQPELVTDTIVVHDVPEIITEQPIPICERDSITLLAQISGGTDPFEYSWLTPKGTTIGTLYEVSSASPEDAGDYKFTVRDYFKCTDTLDISLEVVPLPKANFPAINPTHDTIPYEQTYLLEAAQGYASYEWNTGDTTYYINVTEEGEYTVTIRTEEGCQAIESVFMFETFFPIYVPNAFTPNKDGLNDTFKPVVNTEMVRSFNMSIYNRWGQKIFETNNSSKGWDGENAGPGVYNWIISYSNMIGKVYGMKGMVTLIK